MAFLWSLHFVFYTMLFRKQCIVELNLFYLWRQWSQSFTIFTTRNRSCRKVMFSQVSVILSTGEEGWVSQWTSLNSVEYWIRFEWNKHRCTYVHWRIYSSRDLDTLLYKVELNVHWNYTGLYTNITIDMRRLSDVNKKNGDNCSWQE